MNETSTVVYLADKYNNGKMPKDSILDVLNEIKEKNPVLTESVISILFDYVKILQKMDLIKF